MHTPLRRTRYRVPDLCFYALSRRGRRGEQGRRFRGARRGRLHPEQLEIELKWIDENIGDHPYGVDIVIPNKYEGMESTLSADALTKELQSMVPQEHIDFGKKLLADHGVPVENADEDSLQLLG